MIFDIFDQIQGCGVFPPIVITLTRGILATSQHLQQGGPLRW